MDVTEGGVGGGGDDGKGAQEPFGAFPFFPEAGECSGLAEGADEVGLAGGFGAIPFVEAVGGDEAAAVFVGGAEGGLFGEGFAAGVDEFLTDAGIVGPGGDESPLEDVEGGQSILEEDNGDDLAGGDVVEGDEIGEGGFEAEVFLDLAEAELGEAGAHGAVG